MSQGVSVFIPILNEEEIIRENAGKAISSLESLGRPYELFLVDDGSTDSTPGICLKLAAGKSEVNYIRYERRSYRENLAASFRKADKEFIVFMDADLSTDLRHLEQLVESLEEGADVAVGSRWLPDSRVSRSGYRKAISSVYNSIIRTVFKSKIKDHSCGFKGFRRSVWEKLSAEMGVQKPSRRKMFWDVEFLLRAVKKGYRVREIPVNWVEGGKSEVNFKNQFSLIPYAIKLKSRL